MKTTMIAPKNISAFLPMVVIAVLFFIFGFVTWLNGSLIPFLKLICNLNEFQALFVTFAFYIAYTVMALPMAALLKRTGYKNGMAFGLGIMGLAALLFIPAAKMASYSVFLIALYGLGTGLTILQTASNPYLVLVGPEESAAMRISIMGLINKGAGVLAPILFTAMVLSGMGDFSEQSLELLTDAERTERINELSQRLIEPYLYMAGILFCLVGLVKYSGLPEIEFEENSSVPEESSVLDFPQVVLGAVAIFAYVGVEVIAGDTIGLYGQRLAVENYASLTSYTMVFMVIGYLVGVFCIPRLISQQVALVGSAIAGIICILGIMLSADDSHVIAELLWGWMGIGVIPNSVTFVALMGLVNALVWPAVWPLALSGLGKYTAQGSALLIMGICGGAILPLAFGKLAQLSTMQFAYLIGLPCYAFILYYALVGHKKRHW